MTIHLQLLLLRITPPALLSPMTSSDRQQHPQRQLRLPRQRSPLIRRGHLTTWMMTSRAWRTRKKALPTMILQTSHARAWMTSTPCLTVAHLRAKRQRASRQIRMGHSVPKAASTLPPCPRPRPEGAPRPEPPRDLIRERRRRTKDQIMTGMPSLLAWTTPQLPPHPPLLLLPMVTGACENRVRSRHGLPRAEPSLRKESTMTRS